MRPEVTKGNIPTTIGKGAVRIRAVAPKIPAAQKCTDNR